MATEYKLVELTYEEKEGKKHDEQCNFACSKCVAADDESLCYSLPICDELYYFIEVTE